MTPDEERAVRLDERRRIVRQLREWTSSAPGATMYVRDLIQKLKEQP